MYKRDIFEGDFSRLTGKITLYFPGWATDYHVFYTRFLLEWDPKGDSPFLIKEFHGLEGEEMALYMRYADPNDIPKLTAMIAKSTVTWHLVGFSLGGFIAHDLARQVPEKVASLTLIGVREQYPVAVCRAMQRHLQQDKKQLLEDFWKKAFGGIAQEMFLVEDYDTPMLSRGLAYLAQYSWQASPFPFPVTCRHGEADRIAPLSEAQTLAQRKGWGLQILPGAGHGAWSVSDDAL
jgi:pimeloyl-ACP methyl ester carboxylesterase